MMKSLYMANSLEELENMCEKTVNKLIKSLNLPRCIEKMEKIDLSARDAHLKKDQELQFSLLFKYFLILNLARNYPDFTKEKYKSLHEKALSNMKKLESLKEALKVRYQEKKNNIQNSKEAPKAHLTTPPKKDITLSRNKTPVSAKPPKNSITSEELYSLWPSNRSNTTSLLIVDARSSSDFKESHLNCTNIINVPEEIISKGLSASALAGLMAPEVKKSWEMRVSVSRLIIFDWNSREDNLNPQSKLYFLKEAMTKWDYCKTYKSPILILDGGYEDILAKYPQLTTNPKVIPPLLLENSIPSLDSFDYPNLDPEVKKVTPPPPPRVPTPPEPKVSEASITKDKIIEPKKEEEKKEEEEEAGVPIESPPDKSDDSSEVTSSDLRSSSSQEEREVETIPKDEKSQGENLQDPKKFLEELRKVKPDIPVNPASKTPGAGVGDGISRIPLKKDGPSSGGGILKRSSSSPNIAKLDDEGSLKSMPTFSRANKPVSYTEHAEATYGKTAAGLTGLKNFANNCYMNSILQCLSNTKPLVTELLSINRQLVNYQSKTRGKIAQEVTTAFRIIWSGDVRVYSIKDLKNLMGGLKEIFKGSGHQDSNEFLIILLEYLHEDLNVPASVESRLEGAREETGEKAWGEFRRKNCSIIQRLFYGQHRSTVTCSTCHHSSVTFEQFFNLFVPIPSKDHLTLNDCIQLYMSGEKISGWKCPKCRDERNATKKFDISRLPPILVIALKRFTNEDESWIQKKENVVSYPLEGLDMERFTVKGSEQRYKTYNLYAVSTHSGTLRAGHYKAICKNYLTEKWYMFDDQSVEPLPTHSVRNIPEVYVLFYSAVLET